MSKTASMFTGFVFPREICFAKMLGVNSLHEILDREGFDLRILLVIEVRTHQSSTAKCEVVIPAWICISSLPKTSLRMEKATY